MSTQQHPIYVLKADFFRVLGHPTRVRILELLHDGVLSVGELQAGLGLNSSVTSQHLAALRRIGAVEGTRVGTSVQYRVRDPRMPELLALARRIVTSIIEDSQTMLDELASTEQAGEHDAD
jgi:ArsR family transcriptional regulator